MFRREKEKASAVDETYNTVIGVGSSFRGTLMVEGTLRVDGDFDGDLLNCDRLEVGTHGCVRVDVHVREAVVAGQMHGSVQADDKIELLTGAKVYGDLTCRRVIIEDGVHFTGRCTMVEEGDTLPANPPTMRPTTTIGSMAYEVASGYKLTDDD